jgi:hypothetical protein
MNSHIRSKNKGLNIPYKAVNLDKAMRIIISCGFRLLYLYKLSVPLNE